MKTFIQSLLYDLRLASRSLRRSAGFVATAVLSLGLGIGAAIAGFGVLDAVRFRALPFPDADRLVLISEVPPGGCPLSCNVHYLTFALLREHRLRSIDALSGFVNGPKSLGTGEAQIDLTVGIVSASIFQMLGVKPERGRIFAPEEDRLGAPGTMLIGHDLWMNYFGGDSAILGKSYVLSDESFVVIGVMPQGFNFESKSQAWLASSRYLDPRTGTSLRATGVLAHLAPGATSQQLAGELRTLEAAANEGRPEKLRTRFAVAPLRSRYVTATRSHDVVFAAIVGAILLIACANVASLVLVRAMRQRRELAIRTALGATTARVVRYLFVQNMMLAIGGLIIGLALAAFSLTLLREAAPLQTTRAAGMEYRLDVRVMAFASVLAVVAAAVLSLAPARLLARTQVQQTLREGALTVTAARGGNRAQRLFVIIQTACAVALLVGTGLMAETALRFGGVALGYDAGQIVQTTVVPAHAGRVRSWYLPTADRLLVDFAAIQGVELTAVRSSVPFAVTKPGESPTTMLDGTRTLSSVMEPRNAYGVSPDYFSVMGIRVVNGRAFTLADAVGAPPVAIINEWAARNWWPGENPVGRTFVVDTAPGIRATMTVVGVVRDNMATERSVLLAEAGAEVYRPYAQANFWVGTFFARARNPSPRIVDEMQRAVMRLVPNGRPNAGVMLEQVAGQLRSVRTNALQIAGFAVVGLLLAITGLYGVLSYVVQQRNREIGIRGVLGATRGQILGMVLGQALWLAAIGVVAGLVTALATMRLIKGMLYGTPPDDVTVYAGVAAIFLLVALAASYLPAHRATRVDPAVALRAT